MAGSGENIRFSGKLGDIINPIRVDIGSDPWTVSSNIYMVMIKILWNYFVE